MKTISRLLALSLLALTVGAQTKPNLTDIKPPAIAPPGTTYAVILSPGFGVLAIDSALIDRSTNPPTLRVPPPTSTTTGGQLWDDVLDFSGSQTFTTLSAPLGRVYVFKNGLSMTVGKDYTQTSNAGIVSVTFLPVQPINIGDSVKLIYMK